MSPVMAKIEILASKGVRTRLCRICFPAGTTICSRHGREHVFYLVGQARLGRCASDCFLHNHCTPALREKNVKAAPPVKEVVAAGNGFTHRWIPNSDFSCRENMGLPEVGPK
jgi:hypothetical protein